MTQSIEGNLVSVLVSFIYKENIVPKGKRKGVPTELPGLHQVFILIIPDDSLAFVETELQADGVNSKYTNYVYFNDKLYCDRIINHENTTLNHHSFGDTYDIGKTSKNFQESIEVIKNLMSRYVISNDNIVYESIEGEPRLLVSFRRYSDKLDIKVERCFSYKYKPHEKKGNFYTILETDKVNEEIEDYQQRYKKTKNTINVFFPFLYHVLKPECLKLNHQEEQKKDNELNYQTRLFNLIEEIKTETNYYGDVNRMIEDLYAHFTATPASSLQPPSND